MFMETLKVNIVTKEPWRWHWPFFLQLVSQLCCDKISHKSGTSCLTGVTLGNVPCNLSRFRWSHKVKETFSLRHKLQCRCYTHSFAWFHILSSIFDSFYIWFRSKKNYRKSSSTLDSCLTYTNGSLRRSQLHLISFPQFIYDPFHISFHRWFIPHGNIRTHKWPVPNVSCFIAQFD